MTDKENTWQLTDIELSKEDSLKFAPKFEQNQNLPVSFTDEIYDTLKEGHTLPYATFTRNIEVFKPASGIIDDIFVINDGVPYLITGMLDQFEKMVSKQQISPNTAFVFINPMPGLKTTLSTKVADAFAKDPSAQVPGMGVRLIDYKHGIDQYKDFITKLLPDLEEIELKNKSEITDPNHKINRIMIGSSLSGTASAYIGLTCPTLFDAVIAQSPSPDNRAILSKIPSKMLIGDNIHITCGNFEQPKFAAANDNLSYATELSEHLGKKPLISAHGHQFVAWNEELERVIPAVRLTLDTKVTNTHALVEKDPAGSKRAVSPIPKSQIAVDPEKTRNHRNQMSELRQSQPGYMAPTESSEAKKREIFSLTPLQTTPKPPWKP